MANKFVSEDNSKTLISEVKGYADGELEKKQDTLVAGKNVQISDNVISSTNTTYGAGNGLDLDSNNTFYVDTEVIATKDDLAYKQNSLTAGDNINIQNNVISANVPSTYQIQDIVSQMLGTTYSITANVTGGSDEGNTVIYNNAEVVIIPSAGYKLPSSVTVVGASYSYDNTTGVIVLSNPTGSITITAVCEQLPFYLTFSSPNSFSMETAFTVDGTLEYSTDKTIWNTYTYNSGSISSGYDGTNYNIYMRGTGNTAFVRGDFEMFPDLFTGSNISCSGNIETLLDYQMVANGQHPPMADNCYESMFSECTSLTTAPQLPATTLTSSCYSDMFGGCTSLTSVPQLPATTLAPGCYYAMFAGCTSLYVSDTQTTEASHEWRIPTNAVISGANSTQAFVFMNCLGTRSTDFLGGLTGQQYIYYTQNEPV